MSAHLILSWQRIKETDEHLLAYLSPVELKEYQNLKSPKRRSDWLAGRVACKGAVLTVLKQSHPGSCHPPSEIVVAPSKGYRPVVGVDNIHISISHSGEWACAMACSYDPNIFGIGVDLEKIVEPDFDLLPVAFSPAEQKSICKDPRLLFQYWTAKEAVLKALGIGLSIDLRELEVQTSKVQFRGREYRVNSSIRKDYSISTCVLKKDFQE